VTGIQNSKHTVISAQPLHVRWLGVVTYADAVGLQQGLQRSNNNHLLLMEHPPTYTMGVRAKAEHVLVDVEAAGATLVVANRGGDVTYHGPGQLVGYPIVTALGKRGGGMADTAAYVHAVEQLIIDTLTALGLPDAGRRHGHAGVWIEVDTPQQRKIAAIGVRIDRGRTLHGFALNVDRRVDEGFARIVPCGIRDANVTSLQAEGINATMQQVVETVSALAIERWGTDGSTDAALAWRVRPDDLSAFTREGSVAPRSTARLEEAGVSTATSVAISSRKPDWMRVKVNNTPEYRDLKRTMRSLDLVTVCEEAGCPNIFECWNAGTATFMVLGERCTRACGFCLVDTQKPLSADADEPRRVAQAAHDMRLKHAVITMVARDDLPDGGAAHVAAVIHAIRNQSPSCQIEVLISDLQGDNASLQTVIDARPDVFNHNTETVLRLQRAVRPSASYARSLSVLARAKAGGLTTKTGLIVGMGETMAEVRQTLIDQRAAGVDIVTIGQYLRPTERHLPVARWVTPQEFEELRLFGESLGFAHVESSPLTRSSYHAQEGADAARSVRSDAPNSDVAHPTGS
jgi:lipoyl synthase